MRAQREFICCYVPLFHLISLQEVTLAGAHVRSIGAGGVIRGGVLGIAASADTIAVSTDDGSQQVLMFALDSGDLIQTLGKERLGEGVGGIFGLRFTPDGKHVVFVDSASNRLWMLTLSGELVFSFTHTLHLAKDVDVSPTGDILVADWGNHRICVFSCDGSTLLRAFGRKVDQRACMSPADGSFLGRSTGDPGSLSGATALAMHGDKLFVLDGWNERVQVFK